MKLMHLSDLHLGKRLYEYSLLDDQRHILNQILDLADREKPRAIVLRAIFTINPRRRPRRSRCSTNFSAASRSRAAICSSSAAITIPLSALRSAVD